MSYKLYYLVKKIINVSPQFKDSLGVCPIFETPEQAEKYSQENGDCGVFPIAIEESKDGKS